MNAKEMIDMGYRQDGDLWNKLWISPITGECLSFEQARQEALVEEIVSMADGGPTNGSH